MPEKERQGSVELGCGSLVFIALIVATCSSRDSTGKLKDDLKDLQEKITRLETKIDALTRLNEKRNAPDPPGTARAEDRPRSR